MRLQRLGCRSMATSCMAFSGMFVASAAENPSPVKFTIEPGHAWTPPFGVERVGRPMDAVVELATDAKPTQEYTVVSYRDGKEVGRHRVNFPMNLLPLPKPECRFGRVTLADWPTEAALLVKGDGQAAPVEIARAKVVLPSFEAEAAARPDKVTNPVDLGAILPPADWLLLAGGQEAEVEVAALSRNRDLSGAFAAAWYESAPDHRVKIELALREGVKAQAKLSLGPAPKTLQRDTLHVAIVDGQGKEVWRKDIRVMLVPEPPKWPRFGAVATKLRYDAPILVNGKEPINYDEGWDPKLQDMVVFFPNGARWVFWRGASYCPFWAGRGNTGFGYEWAEIAGAHMVGAIDCVEPLQDKELRYGRVEIVESTPARVHVRWSYQSCDFLYKVWGDFAVEDFYFYPDGLGTRVLTLTAQPGIWVETNEFITFTPPSGYPLDMIPADFASLIWPQGKAEFRFPCFKNEQAEQWAKLNTVGGAPLLHRIRFGKSDRLAAIQYSPLGSSHDLPGFEPHYDRGTLATPMYWGYHWPLSRDFKTIWCYMEGNLDCIHETPAHNSSMHAGNPRPLRSQTGPMPNAQGKLETLQRDTWAWLIGMTDADDDQLRQWAQSYGNPPTLEAQGARAEAQSYWPERRALCLTVEKPTVTIAVAPNGRCVNPVFELRNAPKTLLSVKLGDQTLDRKQYAWDGATLWLAANLHQPATLKLEFADAKHPQNVSETGERLTERGQE